MANMANTAAYRLPDGRMAVDVDTAKTLTIDDSGFVQNVIGNVIVTLPATATHGTWTIRNAGATINASGPAGAKTKGSQPQISPNAADKIQGGVGGTATDDKDLINTAATSRIGDEVRVCNRGETNGPIVEFIKGIWAREA